MSTLVSKDNPMTTPAKTVSDERLAEMLAPFINPIMHVPDETSVRVPAGDLRSILTELAALRAQAQPVVKGLEWVDDTEGPGCPIRFAAWPLHGYRIHLYQWGEADTWAVRFGVANGVFLPAKYTADEAKAAVQNEWASYLLRSRILSTLT